MVDTSVWSLGLRRFETVLNASEQSIVKEFKELVAEGRVRLLGLIRQELLSGIRNSEQFAKLRTMLRSFPDVALDISDYEAAAEASNECRTKGITVSVVDALIATISSSRGWSLFTTDSDFRNLAKIVPIKLHLPRR